MKTEIIISTYNSPRFLRLTLLSLLGQEVRPDQVCIADDGSGPETAEVIRAFAAEYPDLAPRHVWHEDIGFRKNVILNKATATSTADHLIYTDGDCLMSPGFVARHRALVGPKNFAAGSLIRLPAAPTKEMTEEQVLNGTFHRRDWLKSVGAFDRTTTWLKSMPFPMGVQAALDRIYPISVTWMGSNTSALRENILAVNGFDETMAYGGGDKEFGIRLTNYGVPGRHLRFTAPVVHLDHARGYKNAEAIRRQREMIANSRKRGKTWTEDGILKGPQRPD